MTLIVGTPDITVTFNGAAARVPVVVEYHEALHPEGDSARIVLVSGRAPGDTGVVAASLPALHANTVIAVAGADVWRGRVVRRRVNRVGGQTEVEIHAAGPLALLSRSYLPTFAWENAINPSTSSQRPGGPRFLPGTMSSSNNGPSSTRSLVASGGGNWTVRKALEAYVAHASHAGLPSISISYASGLASTLDNIAMSDCATDGVSFAQGIANILALAKDIGWRWAYTSSFGLQLSIFTTTATSFSIPNDTVELSVGEDGSAQLASCEFRGDRKVLVFYTDVYTANNSGELAKDWTAADEQSRNDDNDLGSPAYRRFKLQVFNLPDGTSSQHAELLPSLPIAPVAGAGGAPVKGQSPWLVFAQRASDSKWISLQGVVSVTVMGRTVWIEGINPQDWQTWTRLRITLAVRTVEHLTKTKTGGAGSGRGLVYHGAQHIKIASQTPVRVKDDGSLDTLVNFDLVDQEQLLDGYAERLWENMQAPERSMSWTRPGAPNDHAPGTSFSSVSVPNGAGGNYSFSGKFMVTARRVFARYGSVTTTWDAKPMYLLAEGLAT